MEEKEPMNRGHILLIVIVIILIAAGLALGIDYFIKNTNNNLNNPQYITYEASVTFVLDSQNITYKCELANTSEERQLGLMDRESLAEDSGMLFVFDSPLQVSFWMKNTLIPLDIIFINETGYVVNIEEADPEPGVSDNLLTRYSSNGPVLYVLEINKGLAATENIVPGTYVTIER